MDSAYYSFFHHFLNINFIFNSLLWIDIRSLSMLCLPFFYSKCQMVKLHLRSHKAIQISLCKQIYRFSYSFILKKTWHTFSMLSHPQRHDFRLYKCELVVIFILRKPYVLGLHVSYRSGFQPKRSLEVIMFTSEEPTRFGISCLGRFTLIYHKLHVILSNAINSA